MGLLHNTWGRLDEWEYCQEQEELGFPSERWESSEGESSKMSGGFSGSPGFELQKLFKAGFW